MKATKKEISSEGQTASGILEIPMDAYMNKGKACFSEEIVHGLGYGNVCVTVGAKTEGDSVIIGDTSLFDPKYDVSFLIRAAHADCFWHLYDLRDK